MFLLDAMLGITWEALRVFNEAALYMLFGFLMAGVLYVFIPQQKVLRHLGEGRVSSVFKASLFGVPLPLCSCGVVPTALSLKRQGASDGAAISFMVSTPETGIDSIAITYALMGPIFTIFRPVAAFITSLVAGVTANLLGGGDFKDPPPPEDQCAVCHMRLIEGHRHSLSEKADRVIDYAFSEFLRDIAGWFLVGTLLAGAITYLVPERVVEGYLGAGFTSMLVMLALGLPLYVCASSSTPIASALLMKGLNPGAALVFLLTGPATNAATMMMVCRFMGKRLFATYLGSIVVASLIMGLLLNQLLIALGLDARATLSWGGGLIPLPLKVVTSALLGALILIAFMRRPEKLIPPCCQEEGR